MADIVMAYMVMANIVMAHIVMAYVARFERIPGRYQALGQFDSRILARVGDCRGDLAIDRSRYGLIRRIR